jgi:hypothetical protein
MHGVNVFHELKKRHDAPRKSHEWAQICTKEEPRMSTDMHQRRATGMSTEFFIKEE